MYLTNKHLRKLGVKKKRQYLKGLRALIFYKSLGG